MKIGDLIWKKPFPFNHSFIRVEITDNSNFCPFSFFHRILFRLSLIKIVLKIKNPLKILTLGAKTFGLFAFD